MIGNESLGLFLDSSTMFIQLSYESLVHNLVQLSYESLVHNLVQWSYESLVHNLVQ